MIYREFGNLGWKVSAVGLGTWNIGNQWGDIDEATAVATIEGALQGGMNLFDTADSYGIPNGLSEERLGRALAGRRHGVYIVGKVGNWGKRTGQTVPITTVDMVRLCVHASLYRLHTDWLDVVLCHKGDIEDPTPFVEGFEQLEREGKIRAYGISTKSLDVLKRFNENGRCRVVETDYSLLNLKQENGILPYCEEHGIAVLVRGPLAKGLLSGKYAPGASFSDSVRSRWHDGGTKQAQLDADLRRVGRIAEVYEPGLSMVTAALRYTISHPCRPVTIPGAKSAGQAAMNAAAGDRELTDREREHLRSLVEA